MVENDIDILIAAYLEDELTADQAERFSGWLTADPANAQYVAKLGLVERGLNQHFQSQSSADLLADLAEMEARAATAGPVDITERLREEARRYKQVNRRQSGRYKTSGNTDAPTDRLAFPHPLVWLGMAAALGLAAWLGASLAGRGGEHNDGRVAEQDTPMPHFERPTLTPLVIPQAQSTGMARVGGSVDAVWSGGIEPGRVEAGTTLSLTSGVAEVILDSHTVLLIEGPASLEVVDAGTARLVSGRVVADASASPDRFTLLLDNTSLAVEGGQFGASQLSGGQASVVVFAGSVDLGHASLGGRVPVATLGSGQRGTIASGRVELTLQADATQDDMTLYNRSLAGTRLRPAQMSDSVQFLTTAPGSLHIGELEDSGRTRLFCESRAVSVGAAGMLTIPTEAITLGAVPFDVPADSYLLHMDPVGGDIEAETTIEGSVTFDRPILAVIGAPEALSATDRFYATPGSRYPRTQAQAGGPTQMMSWGLDATDDEVTLNADGRTLTFRLTAGRSLDQVRVLVEAADPDSTTN